MSGKKTSKVRSKKEGDLEEQEELPKSKKPIDLEAILEPSSVVDEKIDDVLAPLSEDSEEISDEDSLDEEEINPFGDKWEQ